MERSENPGPSHMHVGLFPDCASFHPGYMAWLGQNDV
ncbi:MAG: hypothetical protein QOI87_2413, partial [Bradyrhizobium sp.]|nr:hypothetical protein [Bradyrhizobium sp.]